VRVTLGTLEVHVKAVLLASTKQKQAALHASIVEQGRIHQQLVHPLMPLALTVEQGSSRPQLEQQQTLLASNAGQGSIRPWKEQQLIQRALTVEQGHIHQQLVHPLMPLASAVAQGNTLPQLEQQKILLASNAGQGNIRHELASQKSQNVLRVRKILSPLRIVLFKHNARAHLDIQDRMEVHALNVSLESTKSQVEVLLVFRVLLGSFWTQLARHQTSVRPALLGKQPSCRGAHHWVTATACRGTLETARQKSASRVKLGSYSSTWSVKIVLHPLSATAPPRHHALPAFIWHLVLTHQNLYVNRALREGIVSQALSSQNILTASGKVSKMLMIV